MSPTGYYRESEKVTKFYTEKSEIATMQNTKSHVLRVLSFSYMNIRPWKHDRLHRNLKPFAGRLLNLCLVDICGWIIFMAVGSCSVHFSCFPASLASPCGSQVASSRCEHQKIPPDVENATQIVPSAF